MRSEYPIKYRVSSGDNGEAVWNDFEWRCFVWGNDVHPAAIIAHSDKVIAEQSARYIAATLNACAGMSDPVAEVARLREENERLRKAAQELVDRIDLIHANESYKAIWVCALVNHCEYTGPTYEAELKALSAALKP